MFYVGAIRASTGVSLRQLDSWCRLGQLHPTRDHEGKGVPRIFLGDDYLHALWMAKLVTIGLKPEVASKIAEEYVGSLPHSPLSGWSKQFEGAEGVSLTLHNSVDFENALAQLQG